MESSHHNLELILLGILVCIFLYSLLTNAISKTILTLPIIFMVVGYLSARPIEALAEPELLDVGKRLLAEITLILVLFSDASHVRFKTLRMNFNVPLRMLAADGRTWHACGLLAEPGKRAGDGAFDSSCSNAD